jgi:hypothetical protein
MCALVWSSVSLVFGQQTGPPPATDFLFRQTISHFGAARLSARQLTQIQNLAAKFEPELCDAERKASESETQRRVRGEALARAVTQGLRGARARALLSGATTPTDVQRAAFQQATRLRQEFDREVSGLLTESQRSAIGQVGTDPRSGFLIVQLSPNLRLPPREAKTLDDAAAAIGLPGLQAVIAKYGLHRSQRAVKPELLDRLDDKTNRSAGSEIRSLRTFWQIDIRMMHLDVKAAVQSLNQLSEVARSYRAFELVDSSACSGVHPSNNPYYRFQNYLDPAPAGIDAPAAWAVSGGQGAGVGLVDLECGWNIDHEDLKCLLHKPIYGDRLPGDDHGTSVLGEVVGQDNSVGIVGAAPCIDYVELTSLYDKELRLTEIHIANTVAAALFVMEPGDVLLIEDQTDGTCFPVEIDFLNYVAIRLAVASGMIVIEAAGNGQHDLDCFTDQGMLVLNRHSPGFRDSGAIMVGGADSTNAHNKARASCYGSRVDCYGWGTAVTTAGCGGQDNLDNVGGDPNKCYRSSFSGTSSAAPIIAGAAVLVQGLSKAKHRVTLTPTEMRAILADPSTGTPQGTAVPGHIGVMPNLKAIIAARGFEDFRTSQTDLIAPQGQRRICCCSRRQNAVRCSHARYR